SAGPAPQPPNTTKATPTTSNPRFIGLPPASLPHRLTHCVTKPLRGFLKTHFGVKQKRTAHSIVSESQRRAPTRRALVRARLPERLCAWIYAFTPSASPAGRRACAGRDRTARGR